MTPAAGVCARLTIPQARHLVAATNGVVYCANWPVRNALARMGLVDTVIGSRLVALTALGLDVRALLVAEQPS